MHQISRARPRHAGRPVRTFLRSLFVIAFVFATPLVSVGAQNSYAATSDETDADMRTAELATLRVADARAAGVFWRIAKANAPLCDAALPRIGTLLHARSSYDGAFREVADRLFHFAGEVGIEVVLPDGPADRAGLRANDTLVAVNGAPLGDLTGPSAVAAADAMLDSAGKAGNVHLSVIRDGKRMQLDVVPIRACPGRVELTVSGAKDASTDGDVIQISTAMLNALPGDAELAAVMAHEYAHVILHHPQRLTDAHVDRGLLASFGKNRRLIRRTEEEADELSVYLMLNAGYDPMAAVRFWQTVGRKMDPGILSNGTHQGWKHRAELLKSEALRAKQSTQVPVIPPLLATRDQPLD